MEVLSVEKALVDKMRQHGSCISGFRALDRRKDSMLDAEELRAGAAKVYGFDISPEVAAAIVQRHAGQHIDGMDLKGFCELWDGTFTRWATASNTAFSHHASLGLASPLDVAAVAPTTAQKHTALLERVGTKLRAHARVDARSRRFTDVFLRFDKSRSGSLSYDEVAYGLAEYGIQLSAPETVELCTMVDPHMTGEVSLYAFFTLMQRATQGGDPEAEGCVVDTAEEEIASAMEKQELSSVPLPRFLASTKPDDSTKEQTIRRIVQALQKKRLDLKGAFLRFDTTGEGTLSSDELLSGLVALGITISPERAAKLVSTYDRTGSGRMKYCEFVKMLSATMADFNGESEQPHPDALDESVLATLGMISQHVYEDFRRVRSAFAAFDRAGTKQITPAELQRGMAQEGFELSDEDVVAIFEIFDTSQTGQLSYSEFVRMLAAATSADA